MMPKLWPHQEEALSRLKDGKILCGGVGSGKSITALTYFLTTEKSPIKLLIITTAKKRDGKEWEEELSRFPKQGLEVLIDSWNNIKKYQDLKGWCVIFDEQRLVGSGVWVKSFIRMAKHNRWILLSATPGDDWMDYIPVFVANGFYRNRTDFQEQHVKWKRFAKFPQVEGYICTNKLERHRRALLVDMPFERHTVRHEAEVKVGYDNELMRRVTKDRWDPFKNEPIMNAAGLCYAMRRVANSHIDRLVETSLIAKKKKRIIVFYNFDYELEQLRKLGGLCGVPVGEWNGHVHQPIPASDEWVYLVQYSAGSEGWNCISTDTVVFYSLNYSWRVKEQCMGRIDRINTPYTDLYYYTLRSTAPIDLAIRRAIRTKKIFNERAWSKRILG